MLYSVFHFHTLLIKIHYECHKQVTGEQEMCNNVILTTKISERSTVDNAIRSNFKQHNTTTFCASLRCKHTYTILSIYAHYVSLLFACLNLNACAYSEQNRPQNWSRISSKWLLEHRFVFIITNPSIKCRLYTLQPAFLWHRTFHHHICKLCNFLETSAKTWKAIHTY